MTRMRIWKRWTHDLSDTTDVEPSQTMLRYSIGLESSQTRQHPQCSSAFGSPTCAGISLARYVSEEEAPSGYTLGLYSKTCTDFRKTVDR
jgi:hypothetical protein